MCFLSFACIAHMHGFIMIMTFLVCFWQMVLDMSFYRHLFQLYVDFIEFVHSFL